MQFFLENCPTADNHVSAAPVHLRDANLHLCAHQVVEILSGPQVILRAWQKRTDTDIHHQTAFDAVHDLSSDVFLALISGFDFFPDPPAQNFLIGQNGVAFFVLAGALHFDGGVRLRTWNLCFRELHCRDQALGFSAKVHDHALLGVRDNLHFNNFALRRRFVLLVVLLHQLAHLFGAGRFFICGSGFCRRLRRLDARFLASFIDRTCSGRRSFRRGTFSRGGMRRFFGICRALLRRL